MIKPVSELIASAKSKCDCMNLSAAKSYFDEHGDAIIIDVREPNEAEASKLSDSINIPRGVLEMKITDVCEEPDRPILIHCAVGARASLSAVALQTLGYENVHVIDAKYDDIKSTFG